MPLRSAALLRRAVFGLASTTEMKSRQKLEIILRGGPRLCEVLSLSEQILGRLHHVRELHEAFNCVLPSSKDL